MSKTAFRKLDAAGIRAALDVRAYQSLEDHDFDDRAATEHLHKWLEPRLEGASDVDGATWHANVELAILDARASHLDERRQRARSVETREALALGGVVLTPAQEALAATLPKEHVAAFVRGLEEDRLKESLDSLRAAGKPTRAPRVMTLKEALADAPKGRDDYFRNLISRPSRTGLSAGRKAGKSTVICSVVASLLGVRGNLFLGAFETDTVLGPTESLYLSNYEENPGTLAKNLVAAGVDPDDERLIIANLRGATNPLLSVSGREDLAAEFSERNVVAWTIDPFADAFGASSTRNPNDDLAVQPWLEGIDQIIHDSPVDFFMFAVHSGWGADGRSKGSSRLEEWPEHVMNISLSNPSDPTSRRFLKMVSRTGEQFAGRELVLTGAGLTLTSNTKRGGAVDRPEKLDALADAFLEVIGGHFKLNSTPSASKVAEDYRRAAKGRPEWKDLGLTNGSERVVLERLAARGDIKLGQAGKALRAYRADQPLPPAVIPHEPPAKNEPTLFQFQPNKEQ